MVVLNTLSIRPDDCVSSIVHDIPMKKKPLNISTRVAVPMTSLYPWITIHKAATDTNKTTIGPSIVSETVCMYSPLRSWYKATVEHVKHSSSSIAVAILLVSLCLSETVNAGSPGPNSAHQKNGKLPSRYVITKDDFFDFEFAKKAYFDLKFFTDLDNGYDHEFNSWEKAYRNKPLKEAIAALEANPNSQKIKEAHDLQWLYMFWKQRLVNWHRPSKLNIYYVRDKWQGWNKWSNSKCAEIIKENIFSDSCIIPDWRTENQKIKDLNAVSRMRGLKQRDIGDLETMINDPNIDEETKKTLKKLLNQLQGS